MNSFKRDMMLMMHLFFTEFSEGKEIYFMNPKNSAPSSNDKTYLSILQELLAFKLHWHNKLENVFHLGMPPWMNLFLCNICNNIERGLQLIKKPDRTVHFNFVIWKGSFVWKCICQENHFPKQSFAGTVSHTDICKPEILTILLSWKYWKILKSWLIMQS